MGKEHYWQSHAGSQIHAGIWNMSEEKPSDIETQWKKKNPTQNKRPVYEHVEIQFSELPKWNRSPEHPIAVDKANAQQ